MYEQNKVSVVGRILWLIVSMLVLAGLVWFVLWLLFWRSPQEEDVVNTVKDTGSSVVQSTKDAASKVAESTTGDSSSSTPSTSKATESTSSSTSSSTTSSTNSSATTPAATTGQTSSTSTQKPSTLANTGAGDVFVPIAVAVLGGVGFYHIRLRRSETV